MNQRLFTIPILAALVAAFLFIPQATLVAEEVTVPAQCVDKALCAKMIRFGKQSYVRGKYLDAKEWFRKAVQADPTSPKAWSYYDLAAVFALAEKVEQNAELIAPGTSTRAEGAAAETAPPPAPKKKEPEVKFKIVDDEGC